MEATRVRAPCARPVCAPSCNTLLTGFHTAHTQVRDNFELGGYLDEEKRDPHGIGHFFGWFDRRKAHTKW